MSISTVTARSPAAWPLRFGSDRTLVETNNSQVRPASHRSVRLLMLEMKHLKKMKSVGKMDHG
ncbi:hypothetical protein ACFIOY_26145 [Bradyrhizobium sp. TZ2]